MKMKTSKVYLFFFFCFLGSLYALDTLIHGKTLHSNETLVSAGGVFELGFFTPSKSRFGYLGIWFKNDRNRKPVWVSNREIRQAVSTGVLYIRYDGNLVLSDRMSIPNIVNNGAGPTSNKTSAKLLDSGNLILMEAGKTIWQSFDYPTDTLLPGMSLGWFNKGNADRERKQYLSSWLSPSDPNIGLYFLGLDTVDLTKSNVWRQDHAYQQIGFWDGSYFRFFFQSLLDNQYNFSYISNSSQNSLTFHNKESNILRWFVLASDGTIMEFMMEGLKVSSVSYSICDSTLPHSSTGCLVSTPMMCKDGNNFSDIIKGSIPRSMLVSWPASTGTSDCEQTCRSNCSCVAYISSMDNETRCELFYGDKDDLLNNIRKGNNSIYVRENDSKSGIHGNQVGTGEVHTSQLSPNNDPSTEDVIELGRKNDHELPLLSFISVVAATDNFSACNKIGEGGFGPVYKGKLEGNDIAVKRLSKYSGQGLAEFKNEVQLICKVQHRNLVKLLGCCIEQEEKILIYEYMPNRSLDSFIFDPVKQLLLDWTKRQYIIEGITQGLLYLHKYSRLRIIHRDLKTSNILLDDYMNPKISDFGMARILFKDESKIKTKRVAGTYGYMSPEYAAHGIFSTKSDVFSFGVILLEIVSGRKIATFHEPNCSMNLLGYAWELWKDGRCTELMDPTLGGSCPVNDVLMFIQVGLLCVQENAEDRPNMWDVLLMLSSERASLPEPKQPAYSTLLNAAADGSSISTRQNPSPNLVSISLAEAR
nr:receptor-like serine/threonine-protein kinase SD1-8 [Ziziphus jujuba var. spinosa]